MTISTPTGRDSNPFEKRKSFSREGLSNVTFAGFQRENDEERMVPSKMSDHDRASQILSVVADETSTFVDQIAQGLHEEGSIKMIEESLARDAIMRSFAEVREEAYKEAFKEASERAISFSSKLNSAQGIVSEKHQKAVLKCLEVLMGHFARTVEQLKIEQTKH